MPDIQDTYLTGAIMRSWSGLQFNEGPLTPMGIKRPAWPALLEHAVAWSPMSIPLRVCPGTGSAVLLATAVAVLLVLRARRARQRRAGGLEAGGDDKPGGRCGWVLGSGSSVPVLVPALAQRSCPFGKAVKPSTHLSAPHTMLLHPLQAVLIVLLRNTACLLSLFPPPRSRASSDGPSITGIPRGDRHDTDTSSDSAPVPHLGQGGPPIPLAPLPQQQQAQQPTGDPNIAVPTAAPSGPPAHTLVTPDIPSARKPLPVPVIAPAPAPAPQDTPATATAPGTAPTAPPGALAAVLLGGTPPPPPAQPHSTFRSELPSDCGRVAQQILDMHSAPPQLPGDSSPYYTSVPPPHLKASNPAGAPGAANHHLHPANANGNTAGPIPARAAAALDDLPPGPLLASGEALNRRHQMEAMLAEGMPVTARTPARADVQMELHWESEELMLLPSARVLGKGSYGRVVEGVFQGQQVAVKLLSAARMPMDVGQDAAANTQQQGRTESGGQQQGGGPRRPASEQTVGGGSGGGSFSGRQSGTGLRTGEGEEVLAEGREGGEGEQGGGAKVDAFQCLKQEVKVLARCEHPNIVRLLAAHLK